MSKLIWSSVSKAVGLDKRKISYPSLEVLEQAFKDQNIALILEYQRFLETPNNDTQVKIMDKICEYLWILKNDICE